MIELQSRKKLALSLYEKMDDNEMIFSYFGLLNFEITQYLIKNLKASIASNEIDEKYARRLYSSLIEGMENIFKNGKEGNGDQYDNHGIVMLTKTGESFCLTLGNSVDKTQEAHLLENIDDIKDESVEALKVMYKEKLKNADEVNAESANLGLIQIAINCRNAIHFDFLPMNRRNNKLFLMDIFID
jgi:Family of unknown function (DUF6272)